jgi:hypothetical protein
MKPEEIKEWDEILISGECTSENGHPFLMNILGVVGTVSLNEPAALKVWPRFDDDPQLPLNTDGKLWFPFAGITFLKLIHREDV